MTTTTTTNRLPAMLAACEIINAAASAEAQKGLIPRGDVAFVCDDNGGPVTTATEIEGELRLCFEVQGWREPNLQTEAGRDERRLNLAAESRIRQVAKKFGTLEHTGSGDGEYGMFQCYELKLAK